MLGHHGGQVGRDAVAEIERRYRRMRALIPDLDRPVADRGPLSAAQAEAVGRYVEAESHLATLRREPYSYIT